MLGRCCRYCGAELGLFYPAVEIAAIMPVLWGASVVTGWLLAVSAVFGWSTACSRLDRLAHAASPNVPTFCFFSLGLPQLICSIGIYCRPSHRRHRGLCDFALVAYLYRAIRGFDGLGLGDAKLLAGLGMWISWQGLPTLVLSAAVACLAFVLVRALWRRKIIQTERVPFGPFLALAGWIVWLYGPLVPV